ncbi:MAG: hypothetical protein JJU00_01660 [Opitutales bacterium]|nr:hypothetical protein [Opitutales bacterium]
MKTRIPLLTLPAAAFVLCAMPPAISHAAFAPDPVLDDRIEVALDLARTKMLATVDFLEAVNAAETDPARIPYFPQYTVNLDLTPDRSEPDGSWHTTRGNGGFWARGSFAALLWMMAEIEEDPAQRAQWQAWAKTWSEPVRGYTGNDMTVNNYAVFRRWMEQAENEREEQRQTILSLARLLVEPYDRETNTGRFFEEAGIYGYRRRTTAEPRTWYFHAFIDHSPNMEQLLGASWIAYDDAEALDFREKAVRHALNIHQTLNAGRNPGDAGSWQRAYFGWEETSPTYGEFVLNEGKQGWTNASTWSRGQGWWVYGICLAYYHTRHPDVLEAAREAVRYYIDHLPDRYPGEHRRPGVFVPPWDFDYAFEVDFETDYDTSAAALAAAGMVRLLAAMNPADPDYGAFMEALRGTLFSLTDAPFLATEDYPEMSILRKGGYHHPASLEPSSAYNNGLIWGDYFFVDALLKYRKLRDNPPSVPEAPAVVFDADAGMLRWPARADAVYQVEVSDDLRDWRDAGLPFHGAAEGEPLGSAAQPGAAPRFWRLRAWPMPEQ